MFSKNKFKRILIVVVVLLVILIGGFIYYVQDYYEARKSAVDLLTTTDEVELLNEDPIHFSSKASSEIGIIFYPGGKVDEVAYTPLIHPLAEAGYETFIVDMPFHLAVFDIDAADPIIADNPEIKHWYIGGHSLGAAMAAVYAEDNLDKIDGLFLLAGYSTADLSEVALPVLALYGSEDEVINQEQVADNRSNLPDHAIEMEIAGGNHAQFGLYGIQEGDGQATISPEEQQAITVQQIMNFIADDAEGILN